MIVEKLRSLPVFVLGILGFAIIASASGVATLTVTTTQSSVDLSAENFVLDVDVLVENSAITMASSNEAASSDVDATTGLVDVNTVLSADNFVYQFEVKEAAVGSWDANREYTIEVFGDGSSLGSVVLNNSTPDVGAVEGAIVRFDLGSASSIPDTITVNIDRTAE